MADPGDALRFATCRAHFSLISLGETYTQRRLNGEIDGSIMQSCLLDGDSHVSFCRRLIGSKSNADPTSAQAAGNISRENGRRCLEMDSKAVERRQGQVV